MEVQALSLPTFLQPQGGVRGVEVGSFPSSIRPQVTPVHTGTLLPPPGTGVKGSRGLRTGPCGGGGGPGPAVPSGNLLKILIHTHRCFLCQLTSYRSERPVFHTLTDP